MDSCRLRTYKHLHKSNTIINHLLSKVEIRFPRFSQITKINIVRDKRKSSENQTVSCTVYNVKRF